MTGTDGPSRGATAAALEVLPRHAWTVFHDLQWSESAYDDVGHVVVGPGGVFVVGSSGADPVQVLRATRQVAAMTAPEVAEAHVHPVLCRDDEQTGQDGDLFLTPAAGLADLMTRSPVVLSPQQITHLCLTLDWSVLRRT